MQEFRGMWSTHSLASLLGPLWTGVVAPDKVQHSTLAEWLQCSPMVRETWVQSQVESYQRLKKWHVMLPLLTLSIIRYVSRVKWSNPKKGIAPSPTRWCSSYRKGSLRVTLDNGRQHYLLTYASLNYLKLNCLII